MSRKYKFHNKEELYFVSFATVNWLDVFVRDHYFDEVLRGLDFCRKEKGMEIYCYCIMIGHVHLIFCATASNTGDLLKSLKVHTSKRLQGLIKENPQESRKDLLTSMFERAGKQSSNVKNGQF
jgi:REP element-mobilizing transposase RayT